MKTESLTFTRFIAAVCVVIFHFGLDVFPFSSGISRHFFENSNLFVSYFYFLSGFVMMIAYFEQIRKGTFNKWSYWLKRIARIYPIYLFALLLLCGVLLYFGYWDSSIKYFILNLLLIQSWQKEAALTLNYTGWSLSVEMFFYLMFPAIIWTINKLSFQKNVYAYLLIVISSQLISIFLYENRYSPLLHLNTFLGGLLLGKFLLEFDHKITWLKRNANLILVFSIVLFAVILGSSNMIITQGQGGILAPVFSLIIIGLIYTKNRIVKSLSKSPFIILGEISYGIYILQVPMRFVSTYLNDKSSRFFYSDSETELEFFFYLIVLIVFSTITFYLIERPSKKLILSKIRVKQVEADKQQ